MSMKLHLGCDKLCIPGFVHVDLADYSHIDYRQDVRTLLMFDDDSVDLIYACHVIEYFDRVEVLDVLREWRRVLKPGGVLRLAVPDFAALCRVYQQYGDLSLIHGPLYGRWKIKTDAVGKLIYHRSVYDYKDLGTVLESAGFKNVRRYDWRQTIHRDYDDYSQAYIPHMDKEHGILISLNVEAEKPRENPH
jgi:predicted SAM-dependent methyltransferase